MVVYWGLGLGTHSELIPRLSKVSTAVRTAETGPDAAAMDEQSAPTVTHFIKRMLQVQRTEAKTTYSEFVDVEKEYAH